MSPRRGGACGLLVRALLGVLAFETNGCAPGDSSTVAGKTDGATRPTVEEGRIAVFVRRCDQCHQSPDPADGILSGQTTPVPGTTQSYGSNLTPDPDTGMDEWDAGAIATAILGGVDDQGRVLCPSMPRGADGAMMGVTQAEALSIAVYLQSLTPVWHRVPPSTCALAPVADGGR